MESSLPLPRYEDDLALFLGDLRSHIFPSQSEIARQLYLSHTTVSRYETGKLKPPPEYVAYLAVQYNNIALSQNPHHQAQLLHEINKAIRWNYTATDQVRNWDEMQFLADSYFAARQEEADPKHVQLQRVDWGEAPDAATFYGREQELTQLKQWVVDKKSRIVLVVGMGGLGKTSIVIELAKQVSQQFDYVIWRSVRNGPPFEFMIYELSKRLVAHADTTISQSVDQQFLRLIEFLRDNRCLIILDNLESILDSGQRIGYYRPGYEAYRSFFHILANSTHQSCMVLTSREIPAELKNVNGDSAVYIYPLPGLPISATKQLLESRQITGDTLLFEELNARYSGNILAIKLVAETINKFFNHNVRHFLSEENTIFNDIRHLLDYSYARLPALAKEILFWLAIERVPVLFEKIHNRLVPYRSTLQITDALLSLQRMSLVERMDDNHWYLPNVVSEYAVDRLIRQIHEELQQNKLYTLHTVALLTTDSAEYIRQTQVRILVDAIAHLFLYELGGDNLRSRFHLLLDEIRKPEYQRFGFAAGNLLNIMSRCNHDIRDYDFANLIIQHADMSNISLANVDFSGAEIHQCLFDNVFIGINSIALSGKAQYLALSSGNEIRIWRLADRQPYRILRGDSDLIWDIIFCREERYLISRDSNNTVYLWNVEESQIELSIEHPVDLRSLAISHNESWVAAGSVDGTVFLWDVQTGHLRQKLNDGRHTSIHAIAFNPDDDVLIAGNSDHTIVLWEIESGTRIDELIGHQATITCFGQIRLHHNFLISGSSDGVINIWDMATRERFGSLQAHSNIISGICIGTDGRYATSSFDGHVKVWNIEEDTPHILLSHKGLPISAIDIDNAGNTLVSGGYDRVASIWNINEGSVIDTIIGHTFEILALTFSPDGQYIIGGCSDYNSYMWAWESDSRVNTYKGHVRWVSDVKVSPDGMILVTSSYDRTVRLWSTHTNNEIAVLRDHHYWVMCTGFSRDGVWIATGSADKSVYVWNVHTQTLTQKLTGHDNTVTCLCFHPLQPIVASGSKDSTICLWNLQTGELTNCLKADDSAIEKLAFTSDGSYIVGVSSNGLVTIWELDTWDIKHQWQLSDDIFQVVAISDDGGLLAVYSPGSPITIWDIESGRAVYRLSYSGGKVINLAFDHQSEKLASGSNDGQVNIWHITTEALLRTLKIHRPYEGLNITGVQGITATQHTMLKSLGAID